MVSWTTLFIGCASVGAAGIAIVGFFNFIDRRHKPSGQTQAAPQQASEIGPLTLVQTASLAPASLPIVLEGHSISYSLH
jgi:hypothetical protein